MYFVVYHLCLIFYKFPPLDLSAKCPRNTRNFFTVDFGYDRFDDLAANLKDTKLKMVSNDVWLLGSPLAYWTSTHFRIVWRGQRCSNLQFKLTINKMNMSYSTRSLTFCRAAGASTGTTFKGPIIGKFGKLNVLLLVSSVDSCWVKDRVPDSVTGTINHMMSVKHQGTKFYY